MDSITLINKDCLEVMRKAPKGSVDMILTDLPYGTTANKWDSVIPFPDLWEGFLRVTKPSAAIVLTASQPFTSALVMSRPEYFKHEWIWEKENATGHLNAKRMPMKKHESVLVFCHGIPLYNPQGVVAFNKIVKKGGNGACYGKSANEFLQEVTGYPRTILQFARDASKVHPTQKPVDLMRYLIRTYSNPGETVLDATMGSGTTGVAAKLEGRKFIGIEQNKEYFDIASKRIAETIV